MQYQFINNRVEVKAHGDINPFDISNAGFVNAIALAKEKKSKLLIDLHCFGGSVIEGNLIYNTLSNAGVYKQVDIMGIAASMATVIMLPADKRRITDDGFLMLHRPTTVAEGDEQVMLETAKILTSMSGTMGKRYAEISGKTVDEVMALWLNGKDNWMDAKEALEAGLVDEIIVTGNAPISKTEILANSKGIFEKFTARLDVSQPNLKTTDNMKKDLIASLQLEGVSEASSDVEIIEAIKKQRAAQDAKILEMEQKAEAVADKAIDDLLDEYFTEELITAEQKAAYKTAGKALGIESVKALLPASKKQAAASVPTARLDSLIVKKATGATASATGTPAETWDKLAAESGKLEALQKSDPEAFKALYKSKFGKDL